MNKSQLIRFERNIGPQIIELQLNVHDERLLLVKQILTVEAIVSLRIHVIMPAFLDVFRAEIQINVDIDRALSDPADGST